MAEEQNTAGCSEESCASCASAGTCTSKKVDMHEPMNMYSSIKKVIGVVSGKGGVGKSLVTASLARMMRAKGYNVGIMDADITGPSIPKMYGLHEMAVQSREFFHVRQQTEQRSCLSIFFWKMRKHRLFGGDQ